MNLSMKSCTEKDLPAVISIYAPYILSSAVSFEVTVPSLIEMTERMTQFLNYGFLVAQDSETGKIVGFAYASPHRTRAAYRWCCEVSVYVDASVQRKGVAKQLYLGLFKELRSKNLFNAYAVITLPNLVSVKFHEALGFVKCGHYSKIGFKFGQWHDVGWWALRLQDSDSEPSEPLISGT